MVVLENKGGFPWDEPILVAVHKTAQAQLEVFAATLTKFGVFRGVFPTWAILHSIFLFNFLKNSIGLLWNNVPIESYICENILKIL